MRIKSTTALLAALFPLVASAQEPAPSPAPEPAPAPTAAPASTPEAAAEVGAIEDLDLEALLNQPVVTASGGKAESRALAAANVTSITREEISTRGWRSLAEILANVPQLYVVDDPVMPSVGVRGVNGGLRAGTRIVKVMIDGVAVNFRPDLNAFIGPEYIPVEAIERVEIAKGPLSALYGANAFLATVNVITRMPDGSASDAAIRTHLVRDNGGFGVSALTSLGAGNKGMLIAVSGDRLDRSGLAIEKTFPAQDETLPRYAPLFGDETDGDYANPISAFGRVFGGDARIGTISVEGGIQRSDVNADLMLNSVYTHKSRMALENYWASANWTRRFSDTISGSVTAGWSQGGVGRESVLYLTDNNDYLFRPNFRYQALNGGVEVNASPSERLVIRAGVDTEIDRERVLYYTQRFLVPQGGREAGDEIDLIGADDNRVETIRDLGAHVQVTGVPVASLNGLRVTGNVRVDQIQYGDIEFDPQVSWRAAVVNQWSDTTTTKLVAGSAFQTPSGVQMFARPGFGNGNRLVGNAVLTSIGVEPLRPQTVSSVEAIVTTALFSRVIVDASIYYQEIQDKIEFIQSATDFVAVNQGVAKSMGLSGHVRGTFGPLTPYLAASVEEPVGGEEDMFASAAQTLYPKVQGIFGVDADLRPAYLRANAQVRWVGPRGASQSNVLLNNSEPYSLDGYAVIDLAVSTVGLRPMGDRAETRFALGIRNLLDQRYSEPGFGGFDVPSGGRSAYIEARQSF